MNYEQFLLIQLLQLNVNGFDEMAYDSLRDLSFDLIKEASKVEEDEYGDYLVEYIRLNKEKLERIARIENN